MLVGLNDILKIAEARKCAVGTFNSPNMTCLKAVIEAAEELNEPVIITHAQIHEEKGLCKIDEIAPLMLFMADRATVPVCVHLDHGTDLNYVKRALDLGFTSVMFDGTESGDSEEMNYVNTSIVVEMAHKYGVAVEGEIGSMGERDSGVSSDESIYTNPEDAKKFVENTGIDALACAFGTVHGMYTQQPKLDFNRLLKIRELVNVPIVMHGGSGVSVEDYRKVIECGVRKINYYTYMAKAGGSAVANLADKTYFHDIEVAALNAMKEDVKSAINIFVGNI